MNNDLDYKKITFTHHPEKGGWYGTTPEGDMHWFTNEEYEEIQDDLELIKIIEDRQGEPSHEVDLDDL